MAKGKYQKWLETESLILIEGWARNAETRTAFIDTPLFYVMTRKAER